MTRPRSFTIKSYCTAEERELIEQSAMQAGLSLSEFLRRIALGKTVSSRTDKAAVKELSRLNADLGRAGGLLKMLLKNRERLLGYSGAQIRELTKETVQEIHMLQGKLQNITEVFLRNLS